MHARTCTHIVQLCPALVYEQWETEMVRSWRKRCRNEEAEPFDRWPNTSVRNTLIC